MQTYIKFDAHGNITDAANDARDGWLEVPEGVVAHPDAAYVLDGEVLAYTPEIASLKMDWPGLGWRWDNSTMTWLDTRTLDYLKAAKWAEMRAARDAAEFGGFTWDGSIFDGDALSLSRLRSAAERAESETWTLADNTERMLSAADLLDVLVAYADHVAAIHATGRSLRAAIDACTTAGEVAAISWLA